MTFYFILEPGQVTSFNMSTERDSFKIEFQRPIEPNGDIIQYVIVVNGPQVCKEYRLENIRVSDFFIFFTVYSKFEYITKMFLLLFVV